MANKEDVAQYIRVYGRVGVGASAPFGLSVAVELRPSVDDAKRLLAALRPLYGGPNGRGYIRQRPDAARRVRLSALSPLPVAAGDEAIAVRSTVAYQSRRIAWLVCVVRHGPIVQHLTFDNPGGMIPRAAVARLARVAAARIDQALHG